MDAVNGQTVGALADALLQSSGIVSAGPAHLLMALAGILLSVLGLRGWAPLFLIPAGIGTVLANFPSAGIAEPGTIFYYLYFMFIHTGLLPLLLVFALGWHTDFGPLVAHPRLAVIGAAAQTGLVAGIVGALACKFLPVEAVFIDLNEAAAVGLATGADGALAAYASAKLADHLVEVVTLSAYLYMAVSDRLAGPVVRLLCPRGELHVEMEPVPAVSLRSRLAFPVGLLALSVLFVPASAPLMGMFALGNLLKEIKGLNVKMPRVADVAAVLLGLTVGIRLDSDYVFSLQALAVFFAGLVAVLAAIVCGVLVGKVFHRVSGGHFNPAVGAACLPSMGHAASSAVKACGEQSIYPYAAGANAAGTIGWILSAGILLALL
ncbi:MAG: sodium ion-translocating decarboxylase subunit beta [Nitrospinae bacterium]|nr:sodium ion-translocating decarboxylase subunit beta [Nitrospinota bacterium]